MNKEKLYELINDLYFDYDRMSSSGQKTLDEIAELIKEIEDANS